MVEVNNNFKTECEAYVGSYKFGKIKVNYIDDNPLNYEQGAYSSTDGTKIDATQSVRYNKLVECKPNFKYKIELGNSTTKMKIVTYNANQAFIAVHDNLVEGSELTTEATAKYISVTIYSNDTLEGTSITLNNTIKNGEIAGVELQGNTTQDGTPTPDAPVEVENVTGLQEVRVCGKNLIDMTPSKWQNGNWSIPSVGGKTKIETSSSRVSLKEVVRVEPSATYYVSININKNILFRCLDINGNFITSNINMQRQKWVAPNNCYYVCVTLYENLQIEEIENGNIKVQLEKAIGQSEYQKYQGKDYIVDLGGKNIGKIPSWTSDTKNGIDATFDPETQTFTFNGTCSTNNTTFLLLGSTFNCTANITTLSAHYVGGSASGYATIQFQSQDYSKSLYTNVLTLSDTNKVVSSTASADFISKWNTIRFDSGTILDNLSFKVMVANDTDTTYSPYTENPIELNKIGNYQDFIKKGTGKNLINVPSGSVTTNGVTGSWNNNFVQISGTNTKTDANWILLSTSNFNFPDFKIGETYTISAFGKSNKTYVQINYNVGNTTTQKALVTMGGESKSFTVPEDFGRINFMFIGIYRTTGAINESWYLQLNKGPATSYEPYGYKDKWYIEKNVGKIIFDGSENGGSMIDNNQRIMFSSYNIPILSNVYIANPSSTSNLTPSLCNHFLPSFQNDLKPSNTKFAFSKWADTIYIYFSAIVDNVADFKTWLSTHNTIVYYVLATPTYTLIENEELIEQLDAVSYAETQEGITNIMTMGDLPAILDVIPDLTESIRGKQIKPYIGYNITSHDDLKNFKITGKADSNGKILGATPQTQIDIEIFNENNKHNLENKQIYVSTGLDETEGNYVEWQPFTITQAKDTQTKNHTSYTGYDDMMRNTTQYIDNIDYGEKGIPLYDYLCKVAKQIGMAVANDSIVNGDFIVRGNNFTNNENISVILSEIGKVADGFMMINRDNLLKVVDIAPIDDTREAIELTTNLYNEDFQNSPAFGPTNELAIGETNIETNAIVKSDEEAIAKNGVKKIEILDNYFLGELASKEEVANVLWDHLNGFSYYPYKTPYNGYPYIDLGDKLNITDINNNTYNSFIFNYVFEYNGGYKGNAGAEALSVTAAKYKTTNTLSKQFRKVGIEINRVDGKIASEIETRDQADKDLVKAYTTAIEQSAGSISSRVEAVEKSLNGDGTAENQGVIEEIKTINKTMLTQDSKAFSVVVEQQDVNTSDIKEYNDDKNLQAIRKQIKFDINGVTITAEGSTDADMKLHLSNKQIEFLYGNSPVLTINGSSIKFSSVSFEELGLGNYRWQDEADDSLSLYYKEEETT